MSWPQKPLCRFEFVGCVAEWWLSQRPPSGLVGVRAPVEEDDVCALLGYLAPLPVEGTEEPAVVAV